MALANIVAYGLQVTVLVAAAAALARAFRIEEPRALLAYWRTLLLVCLVFPLCQPWKTVTPPARESAVVVTTARAVALSGGVAPPASGPVTWPIGDLVLIVFAAGVAGRALWLTIGACALRRLRRDASPLAPLPDAVRHAQERLGARAAVLVSDRVKGPITFGLLRPVIVFPPTVLAMPDHVLEAIAYHELLHVRRRDWLAEILEEMVRMVLWFHPAVWWLIGRIQLTREQVVDRAAIQLTDSRDRYVEALVAVALSNAPSAFTPVSAFLRRHVLKKRVARILQETTMTTRRLMASLTASAALLALAATFAVRSFPLEAEGRAQASDGNPVQIVQGGEHLVHGERPEYPLRAIAQGIEGDVVVDMTLNDRGEVSDARILSGPEELRKATLEAVLQWHYSPSAMSSTATQATLRFHVPAAGFEKAELRRLVVEQPVTLVAGSIQMERMLDKVTADSAAPVRLDVKMRPGRYSLKHHELGHVELEKVLQRTFEGTWRLADVKAEGVSEVTAKEILAQAGVAIGDVITGETEKRIQQVAVAMDEHFRVEFRGNEDTGRLSITIRAR